MENIGSEPSINHGSLHRPAAGTSNDSQLTGRCTLPDGAELGDGFQPYAVEWSAAAINRSPSSSTTFPQTTKVGWVRVYQRLTAVELAA